jgi:hypothetical protein
MVRKKGRDDNHSAQDKSVFEMDVFHNNELNG